MSQLLSDALNLEFPRNRLPSLSSSILHGHYMIDSPLDRKVLVWRDGRDIAISWYYHAVIGHSLTSSAAVKRMRKRLGVTDVDSENREELFSKALRLFLENPGLPRFTWSEFVRRWYGDKGYTHVKYEDLLRDTKAELTRILYELTGETLDEAVAYAIVEKYSFKKQTNRDPGAENEKAFLRKGISGDWRNHFSMDDRRLFCEYAGDELELLGYETGGPWVNA